MRDLVVDDGGFAQSNSPFIAVGTLTKRVLPQPINARLLPGRVIEADSVSTPQPGHVHGLNAARGME